MASLACDQISMQVVQGSSSLIISMTTPIAVVLIGEWCGWWW